MTTLFSVACICECTEHAKSSDLNTAGSWIIQCLSVVRGRSLKPEINLEHHYAF